MAQDIPIPKVNGYFTCGYSNPTVPDDCFVAHLDTGFRCCYVTNIPQNPTTCLLLSYQQIKLNPGNGSYNCGGALPNNGSYIKYSFAFLFLIINLLF
jgi:hypothetical protein